MLTLFLVMIVTIIYVISSVISLRNYKRNIKASFKHRVHVNGIRGKSTVTRLIAASFREGNIKTVGKTTGTAAKVFVSHHIDWDLERKEANISEQKRLITKYMKSGYKAFVFECMAINPLYQRYLEEKIMYSNIGVITNVREDHMDLMGATIPEIAKSLCETVPYKGHLITAEKNKKALKEICAVCRQRKTKLHIVSGSTVTAKMMKPFFHFEHKDNVAVALKAAELVGIDKNTALQGMYKALPDPGAFKLKRYRTRGKSIFWANLFAINDKESFIQTVNHLTIKVGKGSKKAIILNNRLDRPERVNQFVNIALKNFSVDYIITFGDYEKQVSRAVKNSRYKNKPQVVHLGNSTEYRSASGEVLWNKIVESIDEKKCLLVGAVNIHTEQAESLLSVNLKEGSLAHV